MQNSREKSFQNVIAMKLVNFTYNSEDFYSYSLFNIIRGKSRAAVTFKMERFVIIVNGFQPFPIIIKRSIVNVAAALDPPLQFIASLDVSCSFKYRPLFPKCF